MVNLFAFPSLSPPRNMNVGGLRAKRGYFYDLRVMVISEAGTLNRQNNLKGEVILRTNTSTFP